MTLTRIQYNPQDKVTRNARKVKRKVHFASLMDLCHLKHTEFTTHQQTYQGHVVFFLNRTRTSHDAHVTHTNIFSCVAEVLTRLKDTWIVSVRAFFEVMFPGTLLDALFTSPFSIAFPALAPSPLTTPSLLFPSTSSTPASPLGGMLFGRLAEQSPLTRTTLCIFEDNDSVTKRMKKGRSPATHHEARTHRVDLDGFSSVGSKGSEQTRQHNTTIGRHAHRMILTRDRWTQLTPLVNITTHATFIQSYLSVSSAILKPSFFLHEQVCQRIYRCICNCKADKASSLHRDDCEVVERQRMPTWTITQYVHQVTKATPSVKNCVSNALNNSP